MSIQLPALPETWSTTRVDRVASVNARIGWKALTADEYQLDGYAFLSTPNIKTQEIDFKNVNFITEERYEESPELKLRKGDVLLAKDGNTLGIVNIVRFLPRSATVNGSIAVIRPFGIDSTFLKYLLESQFIQATINQLKGGMGVPHLFQWDIKRLPAPLPPRQEQRRIADFLDVETARIDALMNTSSRQAELMKEKITETFRYHTTVHGGAVRATDVPWMPAINEDWPLPKVGYHFLTGSGTTPTSSNETYFHGDHPWVNSGDLRDGIIEARSQVSDEAIRDFPALKLHPSGTLVVAMYGQGETKGRVGILRESSCVNQACCTLLPLNLISVDFAFYWFRAHRKGIVAQAYGAGQPNLSQQLIRQLKIPAPPMDEQKEISYYLASLEQGMEHKIGRLETRSLLLAERRQALITAAVTGQFDVSTASGRGVTE